MLGDIILDSRGIRTRVCVVVHRGAPVDSLWVRWNGVSGEPAAGERRWCCPHGIMPKPVHMVATHQRPGLFTCSPTPDARCCERRNQGVAKPSSSTAHHHQPYLLQNLTPFFLVPSFLSSLLSSLLLFSLPLLLFLSSCQQMFALLRMAMLDGSSGPGCMPTYANWNCSVDPLPGELFPPPSASSPPPSSSLSWLVRNLSISPLRA